MRIQEKPDLTSLIDRSDLNGMPFHNQTLVIDIIQEHKPLKFQQNTEKRSCPKTFPETSSNMNRNDFFYSMTKTDFNTKGFS